MKNATHAPVYAAMYPDLAEITRKHGYALAVHGSLARDFDLVAIPWVENPSEPSAVIETITKKFAVFVSGEPKMMLHNRLVYTIIVGWGECFFDFSFMPISTPSNTVCTGQVAGATASPLLSSPENQPVKAAGSEPAATCR